jgi:glutathionylspermidine synthase
MNVPLQFAAIADSQYADYRTNVIFQAYKWDPQVNDQNTVANYVLLMQKETAEQLGEWVEQLSRETMQMEEVLIQNLSLAKELGLPPQILKALPRLSGYNPYKNIRLMRFDFHPTETGWALSEVNSDVPGGIAEASVWPEIAARYVDAVPGENVAELLLKAFQSKMQKKGTVAFVHATSYSDDRQVMQFLGDYFERGGLRTIYAAPDHIKWINNHAMSIIKGQECTVDGIVRFFPLEWLINLPRSAAWQGYYDSQTPSCNNPVAMFTQSKRLPLIWNSLGVTISAWKQLLPETRDPRAVPPHETGWIYKPALGRVGEGILIEEAISPKEQAQIKKAVQKEPRNWIAQRRFNSIPIPAGNRQDAATSGGEVPAYHVCVGAFTVDGKKAGFYGRISPYPRIDANAIDIPVLIIKDGSSNDK